MTLGVIGIGYVGKAIINAFQDKYSIATFDLKFPSTHQSIEDVCKLAETIFLCLPTPMREDGACETGIVENVIKKIDNLNLNNLLIIKSTIPPGTTKRLAETFTNVRIVFSPEFLTEANYLNDFKETNRIILGGSLEDTQTAQRIFSFSYPDKTYILTDSTTAEMVKYVANTFLATKVIFANEIFDICVKSGLEFDKVIQYATLDSRLGLTHWSVPGPDGKRGFGGSCFPKDLNGIIQYCKHLNVDSRLLESVWEKNLLLRPEKDWEQLIGRAITKDKKNDN